MCCPTGSASASAGMDAGVFFCFIRSIELVIMTFGLLVYPWRDDDGKLARSCSSDVENCVKNVLQHRNEERHSCAFDIAAPAV